MEKTEFIENELIAKSIHAAFQRASIYEKRNDSENSRRVDLYIHLNRLLREMSARYRTDVSDDAHEKNIQEIAGVLTGKFFDVLKDRHFRIGIAQKALNLYLKYMWCLGNIATPPHCPFDGIVIGKLKLANPITWTKMETLEEYRTLVKAAREQSKKQNYESLADWELQEY